MSDGSRGEPAVRLERPVRIRRSWRRRLLRLAIACLGVAIVVEISDIGLLDRGRECARAVQDERPDAVVVCQPAYEDSQDPAIGILLAKAQYAKGDTDAAAELASELLRSPQRSDALLLLGQIARDKARITGDKDKNEEAVTALQEARRLHRIERRWEQLASDDGLLATIQTERSEFAEALRLDDECLVSATLAKNTRQQRYCHITAASTLIGIGYWQAADAELEIASKLSTTDKERGSLAYQRGSMASERSKHRLAIAYFENALRLRRGLQGPKENQWVLTTELNLAYSYAEERQFSDAQSHLAEATLRDTQRQSEPERTWVAAQIAYRQNNLASAASLVEKYFQLRGADDASGRDDRIDVAILGAQVELERGDLERAARWAQQGIDLVELVRGAQSVLELRPWVLDKRRLPYELRFVALARSGQIEDAALTFDRWQGRTVQDALLRSRQPASLGYRDMADQITQLGVWLRMASPAPFAGGPDRGAVLRTMRDIDLLALIVANDDVWRLTANHGPPHLARLGSFKEINELVNQLLGHLDDGDVANHLATRLLPDDAFRTTSESLQVVLDGRLPPLPVAALRRGGTPLVAMRPTVRALRLPETRCVRVTRSGQATVLAYTAGNLPKARSEAEQVAPLLQTTPKLDDEATKAALLSAAHDAVLHIATHGKFEADGSALMLADGKVSALEISARRIAPSLAVLSVCDAAVSDDRELAGSLVAGFLGAGSQHVVATLSKIFDVGALEIATRFYRAGGVADPVRALARVQSELAKTDNTDWPRFAVFGPDVCREDASEQR